MAQNFKIDIEENVSEFAKKFVEKMGPQLAQNLMLAGEELRAEISLSTVKNLKKNPKGRLLQSWTVGPLKVGDNSYGVDVFSRVPYAAIHETGGVIRPKRVKALAIPNRRFTKIIKNGVAIAPRDYDPGRTKLEFAPALNPGRLRGYLLDAESDLPFVQRIAYYLFANVRIKPTGYLTEALKNAVPGMLEIVGGSVVTAMGRTK